MCRYRTLTLATLLLSFALPAKGQPLPCTPYRAGVSGSFGFDPIGEFRLGLSYSPVLTGRGGPDLEVLVATGTSYCDDAPPLSSFRPVARMPALGVFTIHYTDEQLRYYFTARVAGCPDTEALGWVSDDTFKAPAPPQLLRAEIPETDQHSVILQYVNSDPHAAGIAFVRDDGLSEGPYRSPFVLPGCPLGALQYAFDEAVPSGRYEYRLLAINGGTTEGRQGVLSNPMTVEIPDDPVTPCPPSNPFQRHVYGVQTLGPEDTYGSDASLSRYTPESERMRTISTGSVASRKQTQDGYDLSPRVTPSKARTYLCHSRSSLATALQRLSTNTSRRVEDQSAPFRIHLEDPSSLIRGAGVKALADLLGRAMVVWREACPSCRPLGVLAFELDGTLFMQHALKEILLGSSLDEPLKDPNEFKNDPYVAKVLSGGLGRLDSPPSMRAHGDLAFERLSPTELASIKLLKVRAKTAKVLGLSSVRTVLETLSQKQRLSEPDISVAILDGPTTCGSSEAIIACCVPPDRVELNGRTYTFIMPGAPAVVMGSGRLQINLFPVLLHEMGHWLGLPHLTGNIMAETSDERLCIDDTIVLALAGATAVQRPSKSALRYKAPSTSRLPQPSSEILPEKTGIAESVQPLGQR